jgi:hypothetical protein
MRRIGVRLIKISDFRILRLHSISVHRFCGCLGRPEVAREALSSDRNWIIRRKRNLKNPLYEGPAGKGLKIWLISPKAEVLHGSSDPASHAVQICATVLLVVSRARACKLPVTTCNKSAERFYHEHRDKMKLVNRTMRQSETDQRLLQVRSRTVNLLHKRTVHFSYVAQCIRCISN